MSNYRDALVEMFGDECERCGGDGELEIHHKDRDPENNSPANLELLCYDCHTSEHSGTNTETVPLSYSAEMEPVEMLNKEVNSNGQIYLGRDLEGKTVTVAYEVRDE